MTRRLPRDTTNEDWHRRAACRGKDPELFYPAGTTGPAPVQADLAKAICHRCPVLDNCLQSALDTREDWGIWGGTTPTERRKLLKLRRAG